MECILCGSIISEFGKHVCKVKERTPMPYPYNPDLLKSRLRDTGECIIEGMTLEELQELVSSLHIDTALVSFSGGNTARLVLSSEEWARLLSP